MADCMRLSSASFRCSSSNALQAAVFSNPRLIRRDYAALDSPACAPGVSVAPLSLSLRRNLASFKMKLEKKRSTSMDKIMNKLRSAQRKAQERRSAVLANESNQVSKTSFMPVSLFRTRQIGSLSGCFTCHAF